MTPPSDRDDARDDGRDPGRDDAAKLGELAGALPPLDLDGSTAEQIARRARASVGKPPPRRRLILPIIAAAAAVSYAVWAILKALEVLG